MKRHASINRAYRLVWSHVLNAWVAVAETARGRGKRASFKIIVATLSLSSIVAQAEPIGGQVISGTGSISQSGATTTINQSSQNLSLIWQSFDIAPNEAVNFVQPSTTAIAVNRIYDTNGTQILGQLNANGQVYLINPNGIIFGQGSQVNVGGLIASALDLNDETLNSNAKSFSGNGTGSVINQGTINAADGGYVALLGNTVSNQGGITARLGTVALGAGSAVTLTFNGNSLLSMQVDQSTLNNLAENGQLIQADGGQVIMSAGAKDALLASVVNNAGVIEARTVESRNGTIILQGGMAAGTVNVDGRLDASAPNGGNGGFIETSATHVTVADSASVTTLANGGNNGTWLIDPVDFTIAASGGDMTGAAVGTALAGGNFTVMSTAGATGTSGDINVNDVVSWSANKLTLNAQNNININADLNGSGSASLALEYGQGAVAAGNTSTYNLNNGAQVNLPAGNNFSTKLGSDGVVKNYTVITSLGAEGSVTGVDLQGINGNLAGDYVLGSNIDAAATLGWNGGLGFEPIGTGSSYTGNFDGLGHEISNLTISRTTTDNVGLFSLTGPGSAIRNLGLVGGSISGNSNVGALVGFSDNSAVSNSYATASVSGSTEIGGLVGRSTPGSTISNSYATGNVSGSGIHVGGLVGYSNGAVSYSYATGSVNGVSYVGGLIGDSFVGSISNSYATGGVNGSSTYVGGLAGVSGTGSVSNSYATGNVSGVDQVGGLVGNSNNGTVSNSYATGNVSGVNRVGGLIGFSNGTVSNSYAIGSVSGANDVGGLVGYSYLATINNTYATGSVSGSGNNVGGLVGFHNGNYAPASRPSSEVNNPQYGYATIANSYAIGNVSGVDAVGGLVGNDYGGIVNNSYANGAVTGSTNVGGLVGKNGYFYNYYTCLWGTCWQTGTTAWNTPVTVNNSYWDITTSGQSTSAGGTGYTTAQMQQQSNFSSWNFTSTWIGYDGYTNPLLRSFMTTLTVTANGATKTYDALGYTGGNGVTYSTAPDANLLGSLSYSGSSQNATNAGSYAITPGGLYSNQQGYIISYVNGTLTIDPAALTLSTFDVTKVYDGGTTALGTATVISGTLYGSDTLSGGTFAFTDKNVGSGNKTVTVAGVTVNDGNSGGNYTVSYVNNTTSTITLADLAVTGITANNKIYDATTAATLIGTATVTAFGSDDVTVIGSGTGTFDTKNVGTGKAVAVSGYTLSGADAGNYNIVQPSGVTADITAADLAVTGITANNKIYDATTAATLIGTATVTAFGSDDVTVVGSGTGTFDTKNVGTGKAVAVSGYTLSGADAGNYNIVQPSGVTADITPATLLYVATPVSMISGQAIPTLSGIVNGFVGGETLAGATTGILGWVTDAVQTSPPGAYAINGEGLLAQNYVFAQAAGNATALTIKTAGSQTSKNVVAQLLSSILYPPAPMPPTASTPIHQVTLAYGSSDDGSAEADNDSNSNTEKHSSIKGGALTLKVIDGGVKLPSNMLVSQRDSAGTVNAMGLALSDSHDAVNTNE